MQKENLVLESIKLNEQAVRTTDTKAQIFIAAILFGINAFGAMYALLGGGQIEGIPFIFIWIAATCLSILSLIRVVAPVPFGKNGRSSRIMYASSRRGLEIILKDVESIDLLEELCRELSDIEYIRCVKTARMRVATAFTAIILLGYAALTTIALLG